jgi:hypothetical protein
MLAACARRLGGRARGLPGLARVYATATPPKPVPLAKMKDSFLDGTSSTYLEQLQERFNENPESVDKTWASFFRSLGAQRCRLRGAGVCNPPPPRHALLLAACLVLL